MGKIEDVVQNVAQKSTEIEYDPTKDTNWCHLPMEMRMECIQQMDIKTRTRFGATSMTEKSLVGSKKFKFDTICINTRSYIIGYRVIKNSEVIAFKKGNSEEAVEIDNEKSREEKLQFTRFLLKTCAIENLSFADDTPISGIPADYYEADPNRINPVIDLANCAPFTVKELEIECSWENTKFFLENCPNLEVVTSKDILRFPNILDIPAAINVKEIRFDDCWHLDNMMDLIWKWIETDAELWKTVQFMCFVYSDYMDMFAEEFEDRLIQRELVYVTIRMDDPSKQILLRHVGTCGFLKFYYSCKVIPMNLPVKEFRKGDTWIENELRLEDDDDDVTNYGYTDDFLKAPVFH